MARMADTQSEDDTVSRRSVIIHADSSCRSAWVGRSRLSVCLSVCLFVRSITKTNDPKVFKLSREK